MSSTHELALAALTVLDAGPARQITAAAAGFDSVGLRLKPLLPSDAVTIGDPQAERLVRLRLAETGLKALEIGVVTIDEGLRAADLEALMAFSESIGARFLVCPVADPDPVRRAEALAELCAAAEAFRLVPLIEFNPYSACTSLAAALDTVARAGHANVGLVIDAFHLSRSGGHPDDLATVPPVHLRLVHLCDAPPLPPGTRSVAEIRAESRGARLLPGEGSLWLGELLGALPDDIPISVEAPSASLSGLTPEARAAKAYAATERFLAAHRNSARSVGSSPRP